MIDPKERKWLLREKYNGVESPEFFSDLERLQKGEPLAYVIGWVDFLGARIDLSKRPFIPRPETEWWVEQVIKDKSKAKSGKTKVLDIFAGSGCIGIAVARALPDARVDFADNSPLALEEIQINLKGNSIDPKQTRIIASDVFSNITDTYDLILANPPYIDLAQPYDADKSVREWEPHHALFAKNSGLAFIEELFSAGGRKLRPGGLLVLEFAKGQEKAVAELAEGNGWGVRIREDQYGTPRWAQAMKKPEVGFNDNE